MQTSDKPPSNRESRQYLQPPGKHIRFSESYNHWRDWRETNEPDPRFAPIPPKVGIVEAKPAAISSAAPTAPTAPANTANADTEARPLLIPLEPPFVDGQRYREAQSTERATRLDLFVEDSNGPWIRRHGSLLAVSPPAIRRCQ